VVCSVKEMRLAVRVSVEEPTVTAESAME